MGIPVFCSGYLDVHPPLTKEHIAIVEDVVNLRETEQSRSIFAAIRASEEPDLPYCGGQIYVTEDGTTLQTEEDDQRHGLRLLLRHLLKHFFPVHGYTLNGEIQWDASDDLYDRGTIYVKDNSIEDVFTVLFDPGPSWQPNHFADESMKKAILDLLASADVTGCTSDLTVVSSQALSQVREILAKAP